MCCSPKKKSLVVVTIIVILVLGYYLILKKNSVVQTEESLSPHAVQLASVGTLSNSGAPLELSGEVKSISEANIKTEASGRITHVYKKIGDSVAAGEIIAEIENSREQAALEQAKALLAQAQTSQNISEISQGSSEALLNEAYNTTVNTLRSTYDGVEDIIRNKLDPMFSNPETGYPTFLITSNNSQTTNDVNFERLKVQSILASELKRKANLSVNNDLLSEIKQTETELTEIKKLIDVVNTALNSAISTISVSQTSIDADKAVALAVRTSWSGLVATLSATKDNLTAKTASYDIAQKQGSSTATVTTSSAAIAQTQSGVQLARIALEKTIIRSPISGTLNSLPISEGDFVSPLQPAATVSNNGSLEIVAYITDIDSREIAIGSKVSISGTAQGVVTRMAPALDPLTKKIEVRIGVTKGLDTLRNGQSVNLSITRIKDGAKATSKSDAISIPIVSLKITPDGEVVFTVENNLLKAHVVKVGALLGNRIVITDGLTTSMEIVTDARGLKDGESVQLK